MTKLAVPILSVLFVLATPSPARAENVTRVVVRADALPLASPMKLKPSQVSLPQTVEGGALPAAWKGIVWDTEKPSSRCFEGRKSSVEAVSENSWQTAKRVTIDGNDYLDTAIVESDGVVVHAAGATRRRIAKVIETTPGVAVYGYRRADGAVVLAAALDVGVFERMTFYGCHFQMLEANPGPRSFGFSSAAKEADEVRKHLNAPPGLPMKALPKWIGADFSVRASVSRSSSDPSPLVSLVFRE